jgi:hypothetical protein
MCLIHSKVLKRYSLQRIGYSKIYIYYLPLEHIYFRTVKEGISGTWLRECGPELGEVALAEFFILWHVLVAV